MTKFDFYWKFVEQPKRRFNSLINKILGWHNEELIQRDVNKHRYELVLDSPFKVVRLLGWTDQYANKRYGDYYWVACDRNEILLFSCVGGFVWLKNYLSGFDYYRMLDVWEMNTLPLNDILKEVEKKGIKLK